MEIRLLGQVGVWRAGEQVPLARSHRRCVLAVLATTPNQPVASDTLIDRVWGERPPRNVTHSLHTHVSAIRRLLADGGPESGALRRVGGSYVLEIDADRVDLHRARQITERARSISGDGPYRGREAANLLGEACSLWRGTPLAGLASDWAARARAGLQREQVALAVERFTLELRLGEHAAAVGQLAALVADHPYVEPLAALQMLALYRCGRQADALAVYAETRRRLVDELGDEPGVELQRLHERILRRDPALDLVPDSATSATATATAPAALLPPAELPPDTAAFAGREAELHWLDSCVAEPGAALIIAAIDGTAGSGKTALAVHWAHRVAARFADGQLYVNLRGFDPRARPREPAEVVRGFLEALQVPAERIPADTDSRTGLYRSLLANRQMLVLLDNARDAEQVRPLLPGSAGCVVLVTSRNRLSSLVAVEGARTLTLGALPAEEANQLLERRLGTAWAAEEPDATAEIIERCAGLPLGLAVVAARAGMDPAQTAGDLVQELRAADSTLDYLSDADPFTDLRAVFSWSYRALSDDAARLFRLLGLHPGPRVSEVGAASLAGVSRKEAGLLIAELTRTHLVHQTVRGRYALHDLLHAYATELTRANDTEEARRSAVRRILDHYLHTAYAAAKLLNPQREPVQLGKPPPADLQTRLRDQKEAQAWFASERHVIVELISCAAREGFDVHAWQLAWTIADYLHRRQLLHDYLESQQSALEAARRLADPFAQALAHRGVAGACVSLGSQQAALDHLMCALDRFAEVGDRRGQAQTHVNIGVAMGGQGRFQDALASVEQALSLYQDLDDRAGQAYALNGIGWLSTRLGDYEKALRCCRRSLTLQQQLDDQPGQAATWDSLGQAYHCLGQQSMALDAYERSLRLVRALGSRYREADVLSHLADALYAVGDVQAACGRWRQALEILDELESPDADEVRGKLQEAASTPR